MRAFWQQKGNQLEVGCSWCKACHSLFECIDCSLPLSGTVSVHSLRWLQPRSPRSQGMDNCKPRESLIDMGDDACPLSRGADSWPERVECRTWSQDDRSLCKQAGIAGCHDILHMHNLHSNKRHFVSRQVTDRLESHETSCAKT